MEDVELVILIKNLLRQNISLDKIPTSINVVAGSYCVSTGFGCNDYEWCTGDPDSMPEGCFAEI